MRFSEAEIVEDILEHIHQAGGEFPDWRVGTAQDLASRFPQTVANGAAAGGRGGGPAESSLIYREAYTTYAAEEVVERLAQGFGLQLERETTPGKAAHPGKTVFVYHAATSSKDPRA